MLSTYSYRKLLQKSGEKYHANVKCWRKPIEKSLVHLLLSRVWIPFPDLIANLILDFNPSHCDGGYIAQWRTNAVKLINLRMNQVRVEGRGLTSIKVYSSAMWKMRPRNILWKSNKAWQRYLCKISVKTLSI